MTFEERLTAWNNGIKRGSQRRFARAIGVHEVWVSQMLHGRIPGEETQRKVAREFKMSSAEVFEMFSPSKITIPSGVDMKSAVYGIPLVPVLGVVCADRFSVAYDAPPEDRIPNPYPDEKDVFSLRIKGDCMEPVLRDGEHTFILPHRRPVDKDVVLAQFDGESTLKRYRVIDGIAWLVPENKKYSRIKVTKHVTIKGVARGAYRKDI